MVLKNGESKREELVDVATAMIDGKMSLIEGTRKICSLRHAVEDRDNEIFLPIRAIESETDHFPLGLMRKNCSREYLERMDNEMQSYLAEAKDDILAACKNIVSFFS